VVITSAPTLAPSAPPHPCADDQHERPATEISPVMRCAAATKIFGWRKRPSDVIVQRHQVRFEDRTPSLNTARLAFDSQYLRSTNERLFTDNESAPDSSRCCGKARCRLVLEGGRALARTSPKRSHGHMRQSGKPSHRPLSSSSQSRVFRIIGRKCARPIDTTTRLKLRATR